MIDLESIGKTQYRKGIPASPGIVIGRAFILDTERPHVAAECILPERVDEEVERFQAAVDDVKSELLRLQNSLEEELGKEHARIFEAHLMMLEDSMVLDGTIRRVREDRLSAPLALTETIGSVTAAMERTDDEYLRDRVYDIKDIERRLLIRLLGRESDTLRHLSDDVIVVARELAPTHTASMHKERVTGFATEAGGRTSHAAIMARSLEIPAVVGLGRMTDLIDQGESIIVDGTLGIVAYKYDQSILDYYLDRKKKYEEFERSLLKLKDYPAVTRDGRKFELAANIEIPDEVDSAISHGAEAIGLFRTEYLFIARDNPPTEDEQYEAYRHVVEAMAPSSVVIRTLDVGGDKFGPRGASPREENPFLGWRGIRYSLSKPDVFMRQLRAILRASVHGSVRIMFPMISSLHEVRDAKQVLEASRQELRTSGTDFREDVEIGVMIETPAAATIADMIADEVDFMSIGSNDLVQYSLAVDRGNDRVAYLYDEYHPAVLRLLEQTVRSAKKRRKWVGLCGEMAGNPLSVLLLIGLGLDELSTSPLMLPEVKSIVRSTSYNSARKTLQKALNMKTGSEVRRYLEGIFRKRYPEISATELIG
ncbi:MAG: phosphoenolpyruvate--protein phosphotransferase [Candidatus Eisenbacteria bacterium]|nr:phosphoenolpyruvate--protein phosphotransferase [Candidatus Eisenbacteria bacterium]